MKSLVMEGKKSFPFVDWKAKKINEFFKMTKQEYKEFERMMQYNGKNEAISFLDVRRWLKKNGFPYDLKKTDWYFKEAGNVENLEKAKKLFTELKEPLKEGIDYLIHNYRKYGHGGFSNYVIYFKDYRRMAKKYKLGRSKVVKYPPKLYAAHNRVMKIENAMLEQKKAEENRKLREKYKDIHQKNLKQYAFSLNGYVILVPETAEQIVKEGKDMHHCVGGYADRHLNGKLTILFLRKESEPDKSLYTIEMHDIRLTQVQGKYNHTPLTPEAKEFFDTWLEWVQDGSKRKKDGNPKLKIQLNKTA